MQSKRSYTYIVKINDAIVHFLDKKPHGAATLNLRSTSLPVDDKLTKLIDELHTRYSMRSSKVYGRFNADVLNFPFSSILRSHCDGITPFADFSSAAMSIAKKQVESEALSAGGYYLLFSYEIDGSTYFMVSVLRNKLGATFNVNLDVIDAEHINLEDVSLAVRVDVQKWNDSTTDATSRYVSFIRDRSSTQVPQYFINFIGCQEIKDSRGESEKLFVTTNEFVETLNVGDKEKDDIKRKIFDYAKDRNRYGNPIEIEDISKLIDNTNPREFINHLETKKIEIDSYFAPHMNTLRRFHRISLSSPKITISFDRSLVSSGAIRLDKQSKTLTINDLADDIIAQYEDEV